MIEDTINIAINAAVWALAQVIVSGGVILWAVRGKSRKEIADKLAGNPWPWPNMPR